MADKPLTWEEKLEKGIPLNDLEETKYAATRNTLRRIREQKEEQEFASRKATNTLEPLTSVSSTEQADPSQLSPKKTQTKKKGK